jgi:hypothetical protein
VLGEIIYGGVRAASERAETMSLKEEISEQLTAMLARPEGWLVITAVPMDKFVQVQTAGLYRKGKLVRRAAMLDLPLKALTADECERAAEAFKKCRVKSPTESQYISDGPDGKAKMYWLAAYQLLLHDDPRYAANEIIDIMREIYEFPFEPNVEFDTDDDD